MTYEYIANEDALYHFGLYVGPLDAVYGGDPGNSTSGVTANPSSTCSILSKSILKTPVSFVWVVGPAPCPYSSATYNFVAGAGTIAATTIKVKADNLAVMRENDPSIVGCIGSWTLIAPPNTVQPCSCTIKVNSAGQTKVEAQ